MKLKILLILSGLSLVFQSYSMENLEYFSRKYQEEIKAVGGGFSIIALSKILEKSNFSNQKNNALMGSLVIANIINVLYPNYNNRQKKLLLTGLGFLLGVAATSR